MVNIIEKIYQYFDRYPEVIVQKTNIDWYSIRKELLRVNIKSMLVNMPLNNSTNLILPFIVYHSSEKKYRLIRSINALGLNFLEGIISFNEFEKEYDKEFLLLEKAEYIEKKEVFLKPLIRRNKILFALSLLIIYSLLIGLNSSGKFFSLLTITIGALLCAYIDFNIVNGSINSSICIENGIFSCRKSREYSFYGIPFSTIGIMYFIGALSCQIIPSATCSNLIISFSGIIFMVYCFMIQVLQEKKLCIPCLAILVFFLIHMYVIIIQSHIPHSFNLSQEISTLLGYLLSVLYLVFKTNESQDLFRRVEDFNYLMSESKFNSLFRKPIENAETSSNIVIGNTQSENVIHLYIHTGCKFCPEALREMLNLVLMDDRYCLNLYIKSNEKKEDLYYFNEVITMVAKKDFKGVYKAYLDWKNEKRIPNKGNLGEEEFNEHRQILKSQNIDYYPTVLYNSDHVSNIARFDNIKISMVMN